MGSRRIIIGVVLAAFVLVLAGVAVAYDQGHRHTIADGVRIAGVDVGGLHAADARAKLRRRLLPQLHEPVVATFERQRFTLSAQQARATVHLDAAVDAALARSRQGSLFTRVAREVGSGTVDADVHPQVTFSRAAVQRFATQVAGKLDRAPRDASVTFGATDLKPVAAQDGVQVQERRLRRAVVRALQRSGSRRTIPVRARTTAPKVTTGQLADEYGTVLTVDRTHFELHLWKRLKLVKSYHIAVGRIGLETPAGLYHIQNKAIDPVWHVPNSAWAGDLAGKSIPPGPDNPIKARWLGIFDGAGIHGTDELSSIGSAASHGCVRMAVPDVIDLYDRVPVGAAIYIA